MEGDRGGGGRKGGRREGEEGWGLPPSGAAHLNVSGLKSRIVSGVSSRWEKKISLSICVHLHIFPCWGKILVGVILLIILNEKDV